MGGGPVAAPQVASATDGLPAPSRLLLAGRNPREREEGER